VGANQGFPDPYLRSSATESIGRTKSKEDEPKSGDQKGNAGEQANLQDGVNGRGKQTELNIGDSKMLRNIKKEGNHEPSEEKATIDQSAELISHSPRDLTQQDG
jgi:hypothetical protein